MKPCHYHLKYAMGGDQLNPVVKTPAVRPPVHALPRQQHQHHNSRCLLGQQYSSHGKDVAGLAAASAIGVVIVMCRKTYHEDLEDFVRRRHLFLRTKSTRELEDFVTSNDGCLFIHIEYQNWYI
jgi:hypothetical protein